MTRIGFSNVLRLAALTCLVAVAVLAYPHIAAAAASNPFNASLPLSGLVGVAGMIVIPWQPALDRGTLEQMANPQAAGIPECMPWQLYDTQTIATTNTGPFTFFTALNNDKTLSNVESAGSFPDPQYFILHYIACDLMQAPAATALANEPQENIKNLENILKTNRATVLLNISNKNYGPFSLTACHSTGGSTGFGYGYGTAANGNSAAAVNNGVPGSGGFPVGGAIVIPPKVNYFVQVAVAAAVTLSASVSCRISLFGVLYRRAL
jgi:hypothetical protein